jgi:hypothetical protein
MINTQSLLTSSSLTEQFAVFISMHILVSMTKVRLSKSERREKKTGNVTLWADE